MNSIHLISPYVWNNIWVFDDPTVGLVREPFVAGADIVIDAATRHIPGAGRGFNLLFSDHKFPTYQLVLKLKTKEKVGNTYHCRELGLDAWLCPALYKYFVKAPKSIYAVFQPMNGRINKTNENETKAKKNHRQR